MRLQQLRQQQAWLAQALSETREPSIDQLIEAMEAMMQTTYFTADQLARLKARHAEVGGDAFSRWRQQWTAIAPKCRRTSRPAPTRRTRRSR